MNRNDIIYKDISGYRIPGIGEAEEAFLIQKNINNALQLMDEKGFVTVYQAFQMFEGGLTASDKGLLLSCLNSILTFITRDASFIFQPESSVTAVIALKQEAMVQLQNNWGVDLTLAILIFDSRREFEQYIDPGQPFSTDWICSLDPQVVLTKILRSRPLSIKAAQNILVRLIAIKSMCPSETGTLFLIWRNDGTKPKIIACPGGCV